MGVRSVFFLAVELGNIIFCLAPITLQRLRVPVIIQRYQTLPDQLSDYVNSVLHLLRILEERFDGMYFVVGKPRWPARDCGGLWEFVALLPGKLQEGDPCNLTQIATRLKTKVEATLPAPPPNNHNVAPPCARHNLEKQMISGVRFYLQTGTATSLKGAALCIRQ